MSAIPLISLSHTAREYAPDNVAAVGSKERHPNVRITFINGIKNSYETCFFSATKISSTHGFNAVHYVYDPTEGWIKDIYLAATMLLFNAESPSVKHLANLWISLIDEMGGEANAESRIIHYAHSRGGIVTELALRQLSSQQREKIQVYSFGSPAIIDPQMNSTRKNIFNAKDLVPFINPIRLLQYFEVGRYKFTEFDVLLETGEQSREHGFLKPCYANALKDLGNNFVNTIPVGMVKNLSMDRD